MTITPNIYPNSSNYSYNIVVGGQKGDTPSDQSGTCKIADPLRHHKDISHEDLPYIPTHGSCRQEEIESTTNPPEPGTIVAVSHTTGEPGSRICVATPIQINTPLSLAGNDVLSDPASHFRAAKYKTGKRTPPQSFKEVMDKGALIREKIESGEQWFHDLTRGLPVHAALYPMAGMKLPQVKQIDTAVQKFMNIPGANILSQLPGSLMNIPQMFKNLTQQQKKRATANIPPMINEALESMMFLMSEGAGGGSYVASGRVHEETFVENMIQLLSQAKSLDDLVYIMGRLRSDSTLWGLENLADVEFEVETQFGNVSMSISITGEVVMDSNSANMVSSAVSSLVGAMGGSQSGAPGKFLFDQAAQLMADAFQRIPPGIRETLVNETAELTEKLKHNDLHRLNINGSLPLGLIG